MFRFFYNVCKVVSVLHNFNFSVRYGHLNEKTSLETKQGEWVLKYRVMEIRTTNTELATNIS